MHADSKTDKEKRKCHVNFSFRFKIYSPKTQKWLFGSVHEEKPDSDRTPLGMKNILRWTGNVRKNKERRA